MKVKDNIKVKKSKNPYGSFPPEGGQRGENER